MPSIVQHPAYRKLDNGLYGFTVNNPYEAELLRRMSDEEVKEMLTHHLILDYSVFNR